ncbi:MAG: DUF3515 domain-containing protein [Actinomycetia bacterium]|nr:DUF3515 domain-containing protein [Actinomycetes bacterium]
MRVTSLILLVPLLALVTSGCSTVVEVTPPIDVDPVAAQICADFAGALPDTVAGQEGQKTDPASTLTAAWGDPAIVVRCGVERPAALEPSSQLTSVNRVDWFVEELTGGYLFTTYGRQAYVEVTVPDDWAPEIGAVTELSAAVAESVPKSSDRLSSP